MKLKFIVKDGVLVLRISESRQRFYKRVGYLLKGTPNLEKHWKADKERFSSYSNFHGENNQALEEFKQIYWKVIQQHPELSARQVADYYKSADPEPVHHTGDDLVEWNINEYKNSVHKYLEIVILRERAKQGCNYEPYYKLLNRCISDIPGFKTMAFSSVDYNRMVGIAYTFANRKGYRNMGKTFRAFLGKAHKDKDVEFHLKQIGDFKFSEMARSVANARRIYGKTILVLLRCVGMNQIHNHFSHKRNYSYSRHCEKDLAMFFLKHRRMDVCR